MQLSGACKLYMPMMCVPDSGAILVSLLGRAGHKLCLQYKLYLSTYGLDGDTDTCTTSLQYNAVDTVVIDTTKVTGPRKGVCARTTYPLCGPLFGSFSLGHANVPSDLIVLLALLVRTSRAGLPEHCNIQ